MRKPKAITTTPVLDSEKNQKEIQPSISELKTNFDLQVHNLCEQTRDYFLRQIYYAWDKFTMMEKLFRGTSARIYPVDMETEIRAKGFTKELVEKLSSFLSDNNFFSQFADDHGSRQPIFDFEKIKSFEITKEEFQISIFNEAINSTHPELKSLWFLLGNNLAIFTTKNLFLGYTVSLYREIYSKYQRMPVFTASIGWNSINPGESFEYDFLSICKDIQNKVTSILETRSNLLDNLRLAIERYQTFESSINQTLEMKDILYSALNKPTKE